MNKAKRFFTLSLAVCFIALAFWGCSEAPLDGSRANSTPEPEKTTLSPETAKNTPSPEPDDGTYNFDRMNVDLSAYTLPEAGKKLTDEEYKEPAKQNEIKIRKVDNIPGSNEYEYSEAYSYQMAELPEYDESKESSYTFNGSRVSFLLENLSTAFGVNHMSSRYVTEASDYAYVIEKLAKARYVPVDGNIEPDDTDPEHFYEHRLICYIENENGIKDHFFITRDLHILHTTEEFAVEPQSFTHIKLSSLTDISVEPLELEEFLHLSALAVHYLYAETEFLVGPLEALNISHAKHSESMAIVVEQGERSVTFTDKEDIQFLMEFFNEVEPFSHSYPVIWQVDCPFDYKNADGALKFTVYRTDNGDYEAGTVNSQFYFLPDGFVWKARSGIGFWTYGYIDNMRLSSTSNIALRINETFSMSDMLKFLGWD